MFLYTLISDLSYLIRLKFKYFIIYIISLLIYLLLQKILGISMDILLKNIIGISFREDIFSKLIFVLNQVFVIFITYTIFIKDFRVSIDNLFLRTTIKRWLLVKILSIFIIVFLIKLVIFLLMYVTLVIMRYGNFDMFNLLKIFLNYSVYILFLQALSLVFISLIYINKLLVLPLFTLILIFFKQIFIPMQFSNAILYSIFVVLAIYILEKIYIKKFVFFFERSNV